MGTSTRGEGFATLSEKVGTLMEQTKTLWFYYRNARMWGKSVTWSVRYAREAAVTFA